MIISGIVVGGNKIGRQLGFPTANIKLADHSAIQDGVYAANVTIEGKSYSAMAYAGYKPSVGGDPVWTLEAHIFDFAMDLYDKQIDIELLDFVRPDIKFDSFDALQKQIEQDKNNVIKILKTK